MDERHDEGQNRRSVRDALLVDALAAGWSYPEAAEVAGCSERTVARRMSEPAFARQVAERRAEHLVSMAGRFSTLTSRAVEVIEQLMEEGSERTRLASARLVVEWAAKLRHAEDLAVAVAEIRQHLGLDDSDAN
ncbi:MAG: helix-turn-helix domain-containing protein [Dehalococcoidia bacterium]